DAGGLAVQGRPGGAAEGGGDEAERVPGAAPGGAGRRGLAAVPGCPHAAALGGEVGGGAVPVPAVVRHRTEVEGLPGGVQGAAAGLPGGGGVPAQDVDGEAEPGGDTVV